MPDTHGPYRNTRFVLEIDGVERAGFAECRLPSARRDVVEYREGNDKRATNRKLTGGNRYGPLILKSGVAPDAMALYEWFHAVTDGKLDDARRAVAVVLHDQEGNPGARWEFRNAWPARYEAPRLGARDNGVAIETVEIVNEGFERVQ